MPSPSCGINIKRPVDIRSFQHQSTKWSRIQSYIFHPFHQSLWKWGDVISKSAVVVVQTFKLSRFKLQGSSTFKDGRLRLMVRKKLNDKAPRPERPTPERHMAAPFGIAQPRTSLAR